MLNNSFIDNRNGCKRWVNKVPQPVIINSLSVQGNLSSIIIVSVRALMNAWQHLSIDAIKSLKLCRDVVPYIITELGSVVAETEAADVFGGCAYPVSPKHVWSD